MKTSALLSIFLGIFLAIPAGFAVEKPAETFYTVQRVVDGDTVVLSTGEKVRMIGIDTPESRLNRKLKRDMEKTRKDADTLIALGKRSAQFTRSLVEGKKVRLEFDAEEKDRYGRFLVYLFIETSMPKGAYYGKQSENDFNYYVEGERSIEIFVNASILKAGYAMVMTVPPNVKYKDLFVKLQKEAREAERGLWRKTPIITRGKNAGKTA